MIELYFDTDNTKLPPMTDKLLPVYMFGRSAVSGKYNSIGGAALQNLDVYKKKRMRQLLI